MSRSAPVITISTTVTRMVIAPMIRSTLRMSVAAMPAETATSTDSTRVAITKKCRTHAMCGHREARGLMRRVLHSWVAAPAAAGVMALVVTAPAQADLSGVAEAGVGYSDNIGRLPTNEIDETIGTVGLELDWNERTRR